MTILPGEDGGGGGPTTLIADDGPRHVDVSDYPTVAVDVTLDDGAGGLAATDFAVTEAGRRREVTGVTLRATALDLAFVFDDTGSMGDEIAAMQRGVKDLTDAIDSRGVDARYALVSFKDDPEVDRRFTDDAAALKTAVDGLSAAGGGDAPEDAYGAIETALELEYRSGAEPVLVTITDAPAHYRGSGGLSEMDIPLLSDAAEAMTGDSDYVMGEVAEDLRRAEALFVAVAPDRDDPESSVKTLAGEVNGLWTDIAAREFDGVLDRITSLLTATYTVEYRTAAEPGERREVTVSVDHPTRGRLGDTGIVAVPRHAGGGGGTGRTRSRTGVGTDGTTVGGATGADGGAVGGERPDATGVAFCSACGTDLRDREAVTFCPECGADLR
jgi:hypothetical protein